MPTWRLILGAGSDRVPGAATGARNMAVDHALLESVQQGGRPVLRLYRWDPACLSLGRNQHAEGIFDAARAAALGIDVVRRPTGGLAVLHDRELTYCVLAPLAAVGRPRVAYHRINQAIIRALNALGVTASAAAGGAARSPRSDSAEPCFGTPARGEVMARGRKLVGSAQRCERRALLQHGSILLEGSQSAALQSIAMTAGAGGNGDAITLAELLGAPPSIDEVAGLLRLGFEETFGTRLAPETLTREENARADTYASYYGAATWTWRR
ncbi:MAG: biotin/lipoate A/B protein ligase family protein [Gemmatimonadota bacterium]